MRIERASADICCIGQFRFREFLGFELIRISFGHSVMTPLSGQLSRSKRDVPGVFGPVSHGTLVQIAQRRSRTATAARRASYRNLSRTSGAPDNFDGKFIQPSPPTPI